VVYPVLTNEEMTTESQWYNCFTRNGGNAIPKHAGPEAEGSNPTTGLTSSGLVTRSGEILTNGKSHGKKPDFPNWQKESWQIFEETSGYVRPERVNKWPNSTTDI